MAKCQDPQGETAALSHLEKANRAYVEDAFKEALQEYRAVYDLCRSTMVFFGIANSEAGLGQDESAAQSFDRFLRVADDAEIELRLDAENKLRTLSAHLLLIEVAGRWLPSAVFVDGKSATDWIGGAPLYLRPGRHLLRLGGRDGEILERTVEGQPGQRLRIETLPVVSISTASLPPAPPPPPSPRRRWWLWGGVASVVVGGAVATYLFTRPDRPPCPTVCF